MDFYDYKTASVNGSDIFDTSTTGMSFYNDLIPGSGEEDYMAREKNLKGEIKMMTPTEYFQGCAKIFRDTTAEKQIDFIRKYEKDNIDHLKSVINDYKKKFPMPFISFAKYDKGQEGRHRMYTAGELFGWDEKFPVLVIDYADKRRAERQHQMAYDNKMQDKLSDAIKNSLVYRFETWEEVAEELEFHMSRLKDDLEEYAGLKDVVYDIEIKDNNRIVVTLLNKYKQTIHKKDVRWEKREEIDLDDIDLDNIPDDIFLDSDSILNLLLKN